MTDGISPDLDDPPLTPGVALSGPGPVGPNRSGHAAVDGIAVVFVDPRDSSPHLVFVGRSLAGLLGYRPEELLGRNPRILFHPEEAAEHVDSIIAKVQNPVSVDGGDSSAPTPASDTTSTSSPASGRRPGDDVLDVESHPGDDRWVNGDERYLPVVDGFIDLDPDIDLTRDRMSAPAEHVTSHYLRTRDGASVLVHATYSSVPSLSLTASYIVVQYRDLAKVSAERLLADQTAVVGSLARGHELGQVCHQVCSQIETELGDGSRCWLAVTNPDGDLEPVAVGDMDFELVGRIVSFIDRASTEPVDRVVSLQGLPADLAREMRSVGIRMLWFMPILGAEGRQRGAMVVASSRHQPDPLIRRTLEHLAAVMASAIEHSTAEWDMTHQTLHDSLTRLPNRALIVDRLGQALARLDRDGIALSVLLVDIDRFKSVNDTMGVEVGDRVLLEVANRLLAAVRLGDTVGRISSDQYLVMCVAKNGELDAAAVARRILRSLVEPIRLDDGDELRITASIGVVVVSEDGQSPATIISNAESALERATAVGRGRFAMFEADLRQDALDRHRTEQALHHAVRNDELLVHYQPLVEIKSGYMIGAEALVRWDRPGHGLLTPAAFIDIAEESELILSLGAWVIEQVCLDLSRWPKSEGRSPVITINLAARQLCDGNLVPTVTAALGRYNLSPRRLGFEITESVEISDLAAAGRTLNQLAELGCRIAIDDFGIGHATLDYLRRFSMASALKIDRSFVAGLGKSREDSAIVNASIALAESLGLQVIAEGVEELDQLEHLHELGCQYAQGYVLSRPVPFDQVLGLWARGRFYEPVPDPDEDW